jgi:hypothetical protein
MQLKPLFIVASFFVLFSSDPSPKFEEQTIDDTIAIGYGLAVGDVDGDGKPDILLADKKQFVWYRNGDWKRFVMIDSLTEHDNVCLAARDLNGDGRVEVAVGAQWNPGETGNADQSGSVHYLVRPDDPAQLWKAVKLHHEPTVHRMQWVKRPDGGYSLLVVPLHGRGNKGGEGEGVRVLLYHYPANVDAQWPIDTLDKTMHLTHNFDVAEEASQTFVYLGGKEGIRKIDLTSGDKKAIVSGGKGAGELRLGKTEDGGAFIAVIEPMHGTDLALYTGPQWQQRTLLDSNLKEGHALALGDLLKIGGHQIVVGWRNPNREGTVGIKLYTAKDRQGKQWEGTWIDKNGMACEDLKIADLNGDGKPEIIAAGRSTHNLKIYWNR